MGILCALALGPRQRSRAKYSADLISCRNDGKGSTAIVGKVESA